MPCSSKQLLFAGLATVLALSCAPLAPARADIYRYEAPDGTLHFTDAPTDKRFKVFMRDIKKDKKLRTAFKLPGYARNPAEFEPIINSCSREFGVDSSLVKAVIHAESGYNPSAVSAKGAQGLMQLMPKTAQGLKVSDCFNPSDNIRGGVRYLRFLLDTFKGDESLALAAYNSGMGSVAKYGGIPPFKETQSYVAKVLSYRNNYK
ncbi:Membrane-bound lytic murein transglycosylase C [Citrifermentans bremense]|uniref:Membrane-bound lytic murein transglycosylase C n=1 Tax=Citrifermentans bremense TaxID=60035 RepID=A0A6S6M2E2_9BACT|nr:MULTISPECIES: transglycosylase SLT domain-containing protein [Geobacteraceae]BCG47609.1 Membrane-bound lytic murein transglycosylase C [Citrifermentans bremense]